MAADQPDIPRFLAKPDFQLLLDLLRQRGYRVIGPRVAEGAIVYDEIASADELPRGWTDQQAPGHYRIERRADDAWFGFAVGPHSWKRFLFPPRAVISRADATEQGWTFANVEDDSPPMAFLGVRACELAAIGIQDRVFLDHAYADPIYRRRRQAAIIIAVNCTSPASTCFCTSMKTGPACTSGFDLALTEIGEGFEVCVGTERGAELLTALPTREATPADRRQAAELRDQAAGQITKRMDTEGIRDLLLSNLDHPRWNQVAERCLSCTNCTMVCPTCFCASVDEVSDLDAEHVERERKWDSCFNPEFSSLSGGPIRNSIRARYRQWLTHKLASWIDQFGTSGCVGCGRCITWCPVGIDLTEEVAAIREAQP
ncbi:MAG TPA: 4Fe-4S dicluster domain-containing protein [Pirellulales bacterium]|jgi:formate hydrogenlyase subunit 6/NADH:ubiquinone oxidoreductase subunit I|nr:4Fe-4S dicluster domain-containing protein [Pirellulales bacterium]